MRAKKTDRELPILLPFVPGQASNGEFVPKARTEAHLRAEALAVLVYIGRRVQELSRAEGPLAVTSTVRDEEYQRRLRTGNPEATHGYSLHTTGLAFDVRRRYESGAQAGAFQFVLDDLTARGLIAWIREPQAIHVTVGPAAEELVPLLLAPSARS